MAECSRTRISNSCLASIDTLNTACGGDPLIASKDSCPALQKTIVAGKAIGDIFLERIPDKIRIFGIQPAEGCRSWRGSGNRCLELKEGRFYKGLMPNGSSRQQVDLTA